MLLTFTGEQFEEVIYEQGDGPEYSRHEWLEVKEKLGLPFPNLPWLKDGDVKLTHSVAILRYIAAKHSMLGSSAEEQAKADMVAAEVGETPTSNPNVGVLLTMDARHAWADVFD